MERRPIASVGRKSRPPKKGEKITAGVPLAKIVVRELLASPDLVMLHAERSIAAEGFRRLKSLLANDERRQNQVMVVSSAAPGEGKTFVAMNLALAFAAGKDEKALIVDCDLRRPALNRWLKPEPTLGLTEVLSGETELDHVAFDIKDMSLTVLPAGRTAKDPVKLLSSKAVVELVDELRSRYDRVIFDTPPIVPFTDADVIGRVADGVLLVARAGETSSPMFQQAVKAVTTTRLIGIVLNDAQFSLLNRGRYQQKYYAKYYGKDRK